MAKYHIILLIFNSCPDSSLQSSGNSGYIACFVSLNDGGVCIAYRGSASTDVCICHGCYSYAINLLDFLLAARCCTLVNDSCFFSSVETKELQKCFLDKFLYYDGNSNMCICGN